MKLLKKAQDWNTITKAITAILIMGIVIYIVTGWLRGGNENITSFAECKSRGGTCADKCSAGQESFYKYGECGQEIKKDAVQEKTKDRASETKSDGGKTKFKDYCCISQAPLTS